MKTGSKHKIARRRTRFPHIGKAAAQLGVERTHLWRVLTGERKSASLLARYEALAAGG
ncbi:MAG: hypothetical protein IJV65_07515 [Kiritimatiellae bacterium]|nr:hypothetical protein [Kiritimatiellia bacterium]